MVPMRSAPTRSHRRPDCCRLLLFPLESYFSRLPDRSLVLKPLAETFHLLFRVGREQMLDGYVRWRNQDRFSLRDRIKPSPAVILTDTRVSSPYDSHGFAYSVCVYLSDRP